MQFPRIGTARLVYFDTAYVAKFYLNESDSAQVHPLVRGAGVIQTSLLVRTEFQAVLHRRTREGFLSSTHARRLATIFRSHIEGGLWKLLPVTESLMRRTSDMIAAAPLNLFLRSADAVHLATAREAGEEEIWTSDRHMLAAAAHFGLKGRSV